MNLILKKIDFYIEEFSSKALWLLTFLVLFVSLLSIILRWIGVGFSWINPMLRHCVFMMIFLGGVLATGKNTHITINLLEKFSISDRVKNILKFFSHFVSFLVLVILSYTALGLIKVEMQYGKDVFWGIHSSFLVSIIPAGFLLMSYRFFYLSYNIFRSLFSSLLKKRS